MSSAGLMLNIELPRQAATALAQQPNLPGLLYLQDHFSFGMPLTTGSHGQCKAARAAIRVNGAG